MSKRFSQVLVLALWAGAASAIWISVDWGRNLQRTAPEIFLGAAPLVGRNFRDGWDWRFGWGLVAAGVVAVAVVAGVATGWFERAGLRLVVAATAVGAAAFAWLLALTDGADGVLYGVEDDTEYLVNLETAPPAGEFVRTFVERIDDYTVHVRGHPPGYVVLLKLLDGVGLSGAWPVAMLSLAATALVPVAVLVAVLAVAGERPVRRAAPFLVVAPFALWMTTSADAVFAAIGACGVAALALALRRTGPQAVALGAGSGLLLSTLLFFTYGGAIFLVLPAVVVVAGWATRRPATTAAVIGAVGAAAVVTIGWRLAGFWWFDGATTTRAEYWEGTAQFRIWNYFIVANIAVAIIAVGPATFAGLTRLRDRRLWLLVGGALAALLSANLSQLSKGEVERIWLLFYPWLVVAGAALVVEWRPRVARIVVPPRVVWGGWVGAQAVCAIVLQAALVSKW